MNMLKQHFLFALDLFVDCFECFLWHPILWFSNLKLYKYTLLIINNLYLLQLRLYPDSFDYAITPKQSMYIDFSMARNICYRELKNIYWCQRRHNVSNMTNLLANDMICRKCKIHFLWKSIMQNNFHHGKIDKFFLMYHNEASKNV